MECNITSMESKDDLKLFLHYVLRGEGYLWVPRKKKDGRWIEKRKFHWPEQRDLAVDYMSSFADNPNHDLFFCTSILTPSHTRAEGAPVDLSVIHADIDGYLDKEVAVDDLGALVVMSGRPGHAHVYLRLKEPARDVEEYKRLCRELGETVALDPSSVDNKIHPLDVLRVPGTMNMKDPEGGGYPVRFYRKSLQGLAEFDKENWTKRWEEKPAESVVKEAGEVRASRKEAWAKYKAWVGKKYKRRKDKGKGHLLGVWSLITEEDAEKACTKAGVKAGVSLNASDRSAVSFWLACELAEAGLERDEIVAVLLPSPRNKFSGRADELTCLRREADNAKKKVKGQISVGDFDDDSDVTAHLTPLSELSEGFPVEWLAQDRVARSAVNLLVGDEGIGKSMFWVWLAGMITRGKEAEEFGLYKEEMVGESGESGLKVGVIITEDYVPGTVKPRLEVAGADMKKVVLISAERGGEGFPSFPDPLVEQQIIEERFDLLVVDTWLDTVDGKLKVEKPQDAAVALQPWKRMAQLSNAACLLVCHTNRADTQRARDKYGVTSELRKKARSTLFASATKDGTLVVGPEKNNLAQVREATEFEIEAVDKPGGKRDETLPYMKLVGTTDLKMTEHIAGQESPVVEWLRNYLLNGPKFVSEIMESAKDQGFTVPRVRRAAKKLSVLQKREKKVAGRGFWELP